jgi:hypothetical protein
MDVDRRSIYELTLTSDWLLSKVEDRLLISGFKYLQTHTWARLRWAYHLSRPQYFWLLSRLGKTWASQRNIWEVSATSLGIKREWYHHHHQRPRTGRRSGEGRGKSLDEGSTGPIVVELWAVASIFLAIKRSVSILIINWLMMMLFNHR